MTVYGVGLGPGAPGLVTVRGRDLIASADAVFAPGPHSRSIVADLVPEAPLRDVEFPMTSDEERLRAAWKEAAVDIATAGTDADAVFVTLGDPNIYSTFRHLHWALERFHPTVDVEVVPGVSAATAFASALGVEVETGAQLTLGEARGAETTLGPERLILLKVTDAVALHDRLTEAGYTVRYGRKLFMLDAETVVTADPHTVSDREYFTLAYADRRALDERTATSGTDRPSLLE